MDRFPRIHLQPFSGVPLPVLLCDSFQQGALLMADLQHSHAPGGSVDRVDNPPRRGSLPRIEAGLADHDSGHPPAVFRRETVPFRMPAQRLERGGQQVQPAVGEFRAAIRLVRLTPALLELA